MIYFMVCISLITCSFNHLFKLCFISDEHDDDEASRKKRRMAERAAAGFIVDDEQDEYVCT